VYLAYGVQEVPQGLAFRGDYFAGLICLDETQPVVQYDRWLFRKDDATYNVWDESGESWVVVGLSYSKALWWNQGGEEGEHDEIEEVLCRRDWGGVVGSPNNLTTAPYLEDVFWRGKDIFEGRGINLCLMDSDPALNEIVLISTGWKGGAHLTVVWYDSLDPVNSIYRTYGVPYPGETPTHDFTHSIPSAEFPRWFSYFENQGDAELKLCRISGAAAVGADSYFPVTEGMWTIYGKFLGVAQALYEHDMVRGIPIAQGDFVLELTGKLIPPFAAGYGFSAINYMSPNQLCLFELGVVGEKALSSRISLALQGNVLGGGLFDITSELSFVTSSGVSFYNGSASVPVIMRTPGSEFKFRIKRAARMWSLKYFNTESGEW
jgi:hypothetical protein